MYFWTRYYMKTCGILLTHFHIKIKLLITQTMWNAHWWKFRWNIESKNTPAMEMSYDNILVYYKIEMILQAELPKKYVSGCVRGSNPNHITTYHITPHHITSQIKSKSNQTIKRNENDKTHTDSSNPTFEIACENALCWWIAWTTPDCEISFQWLCEKHNNSKYRFWKLSQMKC